MKSKRVSEILLPYNGIVPLEPSVAPDDKVTRAIELMVSRNLRTVAVVRNQLPVGVVRLEDALGQLGLKKKEGETARS